MSEPLWTITEADEYALDFQDPQEVWTAHVKWDGCIDLTRYFNGSFPDTEDINYLHICDLNEFIDRLTALRDEIALKGPLVGWTP